MRQVFWRILLFYVFAIFVIGVLIPYTDPNLLKTDVTDIGVARSRSCSATRALRSRPA